LDTVSESLMSLKKPYLAIAIIGIAVASLAAWWLQNKSSSAPTPATAGSAPASPGSPAGPGGPQRPVSVEVAKVETTKLVDETQSVGSLRSNQGVMLRPRWVAVLAK
jgi:membrane fusion protein, multidrug efflux system